MKKIFLIVFAAVALFALATANPVLLVASLIGVGMSVTSFKEYRKQNMAMFTLVPSMMYDAKLQEVAPFTRSQKFLFDYLRNKSQITTLDAWRNEALFFDPINYYVRYVVPKLQQGRFQILGPNTAQVVGVTNFYAQAILPQYYNFCFDRLQVNYGTANVDAAAAQAIGGWTNVRSSMPVALGNGDIIIQLNKNIIVQSGIVDFTSEAAITGGGSLDFAGGGLQTPRIISENLQLETDINLAQNQAFANAVNTTYGVEVLFKGAQIRLRS